MASSAAATRGASDDPIDKAIADIVEELKLENKTGNLELLETLLYMKREESPPSRLLSNLTKAYQRILDAAMRRPTPKKEEKANTKQKWKKLPKKEEDWPIVTPRNEEGEGSAPGPVTRLSGEVEGSAPGPVVARLQVLNPPTAEVGANVTPLDALATRTRFGYPTYMFPPTMLSGIGDPPGDNPHKTSLSDRQRRQAMRMANSPLQAAAASSAKAARRANLNAFPAAASCANLNKFQNTDNLRFQ